MTLPNESQHQCTLAFIATLRRKVLASQCIFQSVLDICCHMNATSHEKRTQNIETLKTSMHSSYKSTLFFVETCRNIEDRFVRFCSLRIDVWFSSSESTSSKKLARKLQNTHRWRSSRSHFVERVCWQQWQSFTCFNRSRIYSIEKACTKASKYASLRELQNSSLRKLQNSSLRKLKSASLRKLARKLQTSWYLL